MDGAGPDEGRKRRLPLWMLGVASTDQVRRSENRDENNNLEDGVKPLDWQPEAKARIVQPVEVLLNDNVPLEVNSCFLTKCETKRRKRKPGRCDGDCDGNIPEIGFERRMYNGLGRTVQESEPLKRRKATRFRSGSSEESKIPSPSEEDGELTMEDLMSIAEEYVKADKNMEQQPILNREHKLGSQLPATAPCRNSVNAPQTKQRLHAAETSYNSTESYTSEKIVINISRTGDPAQEMLDLFLGPLLKKPLEEEKRIESITKDMTVIPELRKQSQNHVGEEFVPLIKKKSSLKDKVAMFLH